MRLASASNLTRNKKKGFYHGKTSPLTKAESVFSPWIKLTAVQPKNEGLEDDFPFHMVVVFVFQPLIFVVCFPSPAAGS